LGKLVQTEKGASLADLENWQNAAFKCARIAPSALNLQPWRFAFTRGYICMAAAGIFGESVQLDLGIAMLHIELGAATQGVRGLWTDNPARDADARSDESANKGKTNAKKPTDCVWVFCRLPENPEEV
jgi:hypothetical protein